MNLLKKFSKKKDKEPCLVCGEKSENMAVMQYHALNDQGERTLYTSYLCYKCGKNLNDEVEKK